MSNTLMARYDIIINGGGIVGFTLLNLINKSPYLRRCKVLLIEQAKKPTSLTQPPRIQESSTASGWDNSNQEVSEQTRSFSNRVSSITSSSKKALRGIGAWDTVSQYTKDITRIEVWNYNHADKIIFNQISRDAGEKRDVMFSVLENNRLSLALIEALSKHPGAHDAILWNSTFLNLKKSSSHGLVDVELRNLSSEEELRVSAPLIIGCDGFKSKVRDMVGMKYHEFNLNKTAVVGTVKMTRTTDTEFRGNNDVAYQRFSSEKDTVAALLPLDHEYSSFVISAPNDYAKYLLDCDNETFTSEFNRLLSTIEIPGDVGLRTMHDIANMSLDGLHTFVTSSLSRYNFDCQVGDMTASEELPNIESTVDKSRALFPLFFGTTSPKMVAPVPGGKRAQVALLGDSAHRVHPLAGQGLNLGIQDAAELVNQLERIAKTGENVFNESDQSAIEKALKKYECKRQAYIMPMSAGILTMPYLFKYLPSKLVSVINKCEPIKTNSVRFANGY